jgi:hypothetical protein
MTCPATVVTICIYTECFRHQLPVARGALVAQKAPVTVMCQTLLAAALIYGPAGAPQL